MSQKVSNSAVSGKRSSLLSRMAGFTIIEVMIVIAIVGLIMLIVLLAVPALQRQARNRQRDRSAQLIAAAVQECLTNNDGNRDACKTPESLGLTQKELGSIFTGVNYGAKPDCSPPPGTPPGTGVCANIPTPDEPNWLFALECNDDRSGGFKFIGTASPQAFVVAYWKEDPDGKNWLFPGFSGHCLDG